MPPYRPDYVGQEREYEQRQAKELEKVLEALSRSKVVIRPKSCPRRPTKHFWPPSSSDWLYLAGSVLAVAATISLLVYFFSTWEWPKPAKPADWSEKGKYASAMNDYFLAPQMWPRNDAAEFPTNWQRMLVLAQTADAIFPSKEQRGKYRNWAPPAGMEASAPEEVDLVVLILQGRTDDDKPAYILILVDVRSKAVLGSSSKIFKGYWAYPTVEDIERNTRNRRAHQGPYYPGASPVYPDNEIKMYLDNLVSKARK